MACTGRLAVPWSDPFDGGLPANGNDAGGQILPLNAATSYGVDGDSQLG